MSINSGMMSSTTDMWATPQWLFDQMCAEFTLQTDVCALPENAKCARYFTPEMDGLAQTWGGMCWMNPPYGDPEYPCKPSCKKKLCQKRGYHADVYVPGVRDWVRKAYESACEGSATVVCLLPARTDTTWWHDYCIHGEIRMLRGRLKFGNCLGSAPFPSAIVIFHAHLDPSRLYSFVTYSASKGITP